MIFKWPFFTATMATHFPPDHGYWSNSKLNRPEWHYYIQDKGNHCINNVSLRSIPSVPSLETEFAEDRVEMVLWEKFLLSAAHLPTTTLHFGIMSLFKNSFNNSLVRPGNVSLSLYYKLLSTLVVFKNPPAVEHSVCLWSARYHTRYVEINLDFSNINRQDQVLI